jgi:predicted secreted hydrolase
LSRPPLRSAAPALLVAVLAACSSGPILAVPPAARPTSVPVATPRPAPSDPVPVVLPRDDAPHHRLTEWWYYTGHLQDEAGGQWGFEFVVFRAERGLLPVSWASHLAFTDETRGTFVYDERSEVGPQVDRSAQAEAGFDLAITGEATVGEQLPAWQMRGAEGRDRLLAAIPSGPALDLELRAERPAALHDRDGWLEFGPAGGSYYYSRTRMSAQGALEVGGRRRAVEGLAWFDHQWGDFIAVGGGGWDWFAINLDDGTDLTLSLVRDRDGGVALAYGTLVRPTGRSEHLPADAFTVRSLDEWTSPTTRVVYPARWRVEVPAEELVIDLEPTVSEQELDTRGSTGVVYWEGSQRVEATRRGEPLGGEAYVELTGYAG